ncbi:DUF7693 family protein [Pseudomonas hamedanensis]|uniref:DUF7693 domain-containing protein n=1 Tax=Pseudomonas hamedanensis TaxID=2745504 RepID=A0A9E6P0Z7_9PSED|nr:hypothetical protein [Pseudomonas hamedanensis]QXI17730.1 hypothetical protein HU739_001665 [Pseudomonas hamedanensis]
MSAFLSAREVCQRLREAALGVLELTVDQAPREAGRVVIDIDGWHLIVDFEGEQLHHCEYARSSDGREGALDVWQRYGTDPVNWLSTWELAQLEKRLAERV